MERTQELSQKLEKHRFFLSREEFAKDRIRGIREAFEELRKEYPGLLSFNLYGSMSKGNPSVESDADLIIFIDKKVVSQNKDIEQVKLRQELKTVIGHKLAEKFKVDIDFIMSEDFTLTIVLLNKSGIDQNLTSAREAFERVEKWKEQNPNQKDTEPGFGMWSRVFDGDLYYWHAMIMFSGVAVGRGINKYRKYVLRSLKEMDKIGEKIWQMGMRTIRIHERADILEDKANSSPADPRYIYKEEFKNLYPQTIDEAFKYYHLKQR